MHLGGYEKEKQEMIIAGAKCDCCGRVDTMNYVTEAALEVLLRQKGWVFEGKKTICRICSIAERKEKENK